MPGYPPASAATTKAGDTVTAVMSEAAAVSIEPAPSTAAEQRHQVQIALQPQLMAAYLQELFGAPGARHTPECRILDMKYEPGDYCTVLYQFGERMLIGTFRWGQAEG